MNKYQNRNRRSPPNTFKPQIVRKTFFQVIGESKQDFDEGKWKFPDRE